MKKWLSLLLILALCGTMVPAAVAEEEDTLIAAPVDAEVVDAADSENSQILIEATGVASDDGDGTAAPDGQNPQAPADAATESNAKAFDFGYGRVAADSLDVTVDTGDGQAQVRLSRGDIVLAVSRSEDQLSIAFNTLRGVVTAWTAADNIEPLTAAEVEAFMDGIGGAGVVLYNGDENTPLPNLNCEFPTSDAPQGEDEQNQPGDNTQPGDENNQNQPGENTQPGTEDNQNPNTENTQPGTGDNQNQPGDNTQPGTGDNQNPNAENTQPGTGDNQNQTGENTQPGTEDNQNPNTENTQPGDENNQNPNAENTQPGTGDNQNQGTENTQPGTGDNQNQGTENTQPGTEDNQNPNADNNQPGTGDNQNQGTENTQPGTEGEQPGAEGEQPGEGEGEPEVKPEPEDILLTFTSVTIGKKEYYTGIKAQLVPENAEATITWSTSNGKYVTVNENGDVYGRKYGGAYIFATTDNGIRKACYVAVRNKPTKLYLAPGSVALSEGMEQQLSIGFKKNTASGAITYVSSDETVATVSETGLIQAVGEGTATITACTYNGKRSYCRVSVHGAPDSVVLNQEEIVIASEQRAAVGTTVLAADGSVTPTRLTFSVDPESADPECVSVDPDTGAVVGVRRGEAKIVATAHNGVQSRPCLVRVIEAPGEITLDVDALSIGLKERYAGLEDKLHLIPKEGETECSAVVTWSSSNRKVVVVDANTGAIYGKKKGSAYVYARTHNGLVCRCLVRVYKAPKRVYVSPASAVLAEGMSIQLYTSLTKKSAAIRAFSSSDPEAVDVTEDGIATALTPGKTATITVSTYNGKRAYSTIKVVARPDQVFLPETLTTAVGHTTGISASVVGEEGAESTSTYTYSAEDGTGSISINPDTGEIVGRTPGTAYVRVTTYNGVSTHLRDGARVETVCEVTVKEAPVKVELSTTYAVIGVGQTLELNPVLRGPDGEDLTVIGYGAHSSKWKKASVSADGVVYGRKKGTVRIRIMAYNGVYADCTVRVIDAPKKVYISPARPVLGVGQSGQLRISFTKGSTAGYTLYNSNPDVVSMDETGLLTGLQVGTSVVSVRTHNGKTSSVTVTVLPAPSYVSLNADYDLFFDKLSDNYHTQYKKTMAVGSAFQLVYENEYMTSGVVQAYESSDPSVATVSDTGRITAVAPGYATITLRSTGGAETKCLVTVTTASGALPPRIYFATSKVTVREGKTVVMPRLFGENISAESLNSVTYRTTDTTIASTSSNEDDEVRLIRGKQAGTTQITAMAGGVAARLEVTVTDDAMAEMSFDYPVVSLTVGESWKAVVRDEYGDAVFAALTSGDPGIVAVAADGTLTAMAAGVATITAEAEGLTATLDVKVSGEPDSYSIYPAQLRLGAGQRSAVGAYTVDGASAANVRYTSDNPSVATVNARGQVIGRMAGEAHITAYVNGEALEQTCAVTVFNAPSKLVFSPSAIKECLGAGGVQLNYEFGAGEYGVVSFASRNATVADVDEDGYVTFYSVGKTVIIATTDNGLTATIDVEVKPDPSPTPNYRLFAAYNYCDSKVSGYLPFPGNNADSMAKVFAGSDIDGGKYQTKVLGNKSKKAILSGIASFFSGTTDNDVSIVYLCSHGHKTGAYSGYRMSLPGYSGPNASPNYYMTSSEIFSCVSRIRGKVILIIDSCYSGTFIEDMRSSLDREGGRISVMTAASDTIASYYRTNDTKQAVDFFTFFLLEGLGYDEKQGRYITNEEGKRVITAANRNDVITVSSLYNWVSSCISKNVPTYKGKSWFWGSPSQRCSYYAGANANLEIFRP